MVHSQRDIEIGQRVPGTVGDQGFLGDRGGEPELGYVHLLPPGCRILPWRARQCRTTRADRGRAAAWRRAIAICGCSARPAAASPVSAGTRASVHRSHATASQRRG
jgi:hypothetical protein